jgi:subtilisin-like proprotein convertase family protein
MQNRRKENLVFLVFFLVMLLCPLCRGVVYTFGGGFDLPIPNNPDETKGWMDDAIVVVPDHYIVEDIDVAVTITHSNVFDLQLYLQSPAGTKICLNMYNSDRDFFKGQNYTQTIFDDEAAIPIEQADAPFTGRFRPIQPFKLSLFDGEDACGQWKLQVYDAYYSDRGTLNNFEIIVTTTPEPETFLLLLSGAMLMFVFHHNKNG